MDGFPAGLRVLVVDDDRTWLKILEKMLIKCSYEVTTCCRAKAALDMLRERKDRFDIVISDVNMPDMDGFKLLEYVGLEMDLPVIMMSVDGETSRVMKGVQHGACDYLLKPIRMKELRIMWQHVYRKKINEMKEIENHDHDSNEMKTGLDDSEDEFFLCGSDPNCTKKRKEMGNEENGSQGFNNDSGASKKVRVVWSVDLHQKFVNAVNQIGFDKVGPKKILDLMNVPGLTRENVASHLQKYRLYLSRLQKKNEPGTSFCGIKQSDFSFEDPEKSGLQSSTMTQHNSFNRFGYSADKNIIQDLIPEIQKNKMKSIVSFLPATEAKSSLRGDVPGAHTAPQQGIVHQFGGMISDADCTSFGSTISQKQPWSGESSVMQFMKQVKQDDEPYLGNPCLPSHSQQHHFQLDHEKTSVSTSARTYTSFTDKTGPSEIKPLCADYKSNRVRSASPIACLTDSFSEKLPQGFGAMPVSSTSSSNMKHDPAQQSMNSWQSPPSLTLKNGSFSASSHEDLQLCSLESSGRLENFWLDSMEFFDLGDSSSITELQSYVHDDLRFSCDYQTDLIEYPIRDEGVFTS